MERPLLTISIPYLPEDVNEEGLHCTQKKEERQADEAWGGMAWGKHPCSLKTSSVNPDGLLSNPEQTIYKFSARLKSTN